MGLVFDAFGATVLKPGGELGAVLPWSELTGLEAAPGPSAPDGRPAALVVLRRPGRDHHFVVPTEDPSALAALLGRYAGRVGAGARRARRSRLRSVLAVGGVLVVAAIVAVLLLASAGEIKL
jgi:hypothetical protein